MLSENIKIGFEYSRKDISKILGDERIAISREGIVYLDGKVLLFVTLDKANKDKNIHYNDYFDEDLFHWDSQNNQHIDTPRIMEIRVGASDVYLFCRVFDKIKNISQPFIFCGELLYLEHDELTHNPVHIIYVAVDYQETAPVSLEEIYQWSPEAKGYVTSVKKAKKKSARTRKKGNLSRKQFIESQGASCRNWTWSWSFINEQEKIIIFGAWDIRTEGNTSLILSESWEYGSTGRRQAGYKQAIEHIRLVEGNGYQLQTFPMTFSDLNRDKDGIGPATIGGFIPKLSNKTLHKVGEDWYASDDVMPVTIAEEVVKPEAFYEGASKTISVNTYERNPDARKKCIEHYGYVCAVCSFDFEKRYGSIGENYIHVHHRVPISEIKKEYQLDPINDLIPVCPNCHSMIHKTTPALTVDQLKAHLTTIKRD